MSRILCKVGGGGGKAPKGDAIPANVLAGKTFSNKGNVGLTGTMINRGAVTATIGAGETYAIGDGYHNGNGIITAKSLASETSGTATAPDILTGKTAWVNGVKVTGSIISQAGGTYNPTTSVKTLVSGGRYVSSDVKVNAFALPPASALKKGYKYTLYGQSVTGSFEGYTTSPLVIYNSGTWSSGYGMSVTHGTVITSNNSLQLGSSYFDNGLRINKVINLQPYNYLKIRIGMLHAFNNDYVINTKVTLAIATSSNLTTSGFSKSIVKTASDSDIRKYDHILDVSSISGNYYIYVVEHTDRPQGYATVTKIWLENQ